MEDFRSNLSANSPQPSRREVLQSTTVVGFAALTGTVTSRGASGEPGGTERWRVELGPITYASPTIVDGQVFIGSATPPEEQEPGQVVALDTANGSEEWRVETTGMLNVSPNVVDGTVYVMDQRATVYALDTMDGGEQWVVELREGGAGSPAATAPHCPTVAGDAVFVGPADQFAALDAMDGDEYWQIDEALSTPAIVENTVYTDDGIARAASDGSVKWDDQRHLVRMPPTVANKTVFWSGYSTGNEDTGEIHAVAAGDGSEEWTFTFHGLVDSMPTVAGDTLYVSILDMEAGQTPTLLALDIADGSERWSTPLTSRGSAPTVADGVVFVNAGDIYAIDAADGSERWSLPGGSDSSPTVVDGTLYVGDGVNLLAIDTGIDGSSTDTRVELGTLGHHHEWARRSAEMSLDIEAADDGMLDSAGPGFGIAGGLTGLAGGGYLLQRRYRNRNTSPEDDR